MSPHTAAVSPVVSRTPPAAAAAHARPAAPPGSARAPDLPAPRTAASPASPRRTLLAARPGDSGGRLALGGTSGGGTIEAGASGATRAGSVPNPAVGGSGAGAGEVPHGKGSAEPVPNPVKTAEPGAQVAAPARHEDPPPPTPARVKLRICARSGLLAGKYCDETTERSFLERDAPSGRCTRCQAPEVEHVNRVAEVSEPAIKKEVEPDYPEELREQGVQGTVTVRYTVDENGKVTDAGVARSSGSDVLDDAALRAIRRFLYYPARQNGQPRPFRKTKQFVFRLSG
jgi:TonB family protein